MPVDFDKLTPENFKELAFANKSDINITKIGDESYRTSMEFLINVVKYLTERLNAISHVKLNPHEWENRYNAKNAEMDKSKFYTDAFGSSQDPIGNNGDKILELSVDSFNKAYNYMNPNTRISEDLKVRDTIPLIENGDKITLSNIMNGFTDILKVKQWLDANFSKYFDSNKMCIMPCQIGCQTGCQVANQVAKNEIELDNSCSEYPPNIGIEGVKALDIHNMGVHYHVRTDRNLLYLVGDLANMDIDYSRITDEYDSRGRQFANIVGVVNPRVSKSIDEYNKKREEFNRSQIGKDPCVWKPYYSYWWDSYVLPITEEWLSWNKMKKALMETSARPKAWEGDLGGSAGFIISRRSVLNNLNEHAKWAKYGRYLFVHCESDYLIQSKSPDPKYEKYTYDYYRYTKCASKNNEYTYFNHKLGDGYNRQGEEVESDPPWDPKKTYDNSNYIIRETLRF